MCGIFAVFGFLGPVETMRPKAIGLSKRLRHRGPDWSGIEIHKNNVLSHERLAIVGVDSGAQPIKSNDGNIILCVNGEIYNHLDIRKSLLKKAALEGKKEPVFSTGSDCEVIIHLYLEYGTALVNYLDGMFSFVLYDKVQDRFIAARDPVGIIPLYQGKAQDGSIWFASELKAIFEDTKVTSFEPGTLFDSKSMRADRWYKPIWWDETWSPKSSPGLIKLTNNEKVTPASMKDLHGKLEIDPSTLKRVRESLEKAVEKQLMAEVPYGVLLSGGLDSSLIASIAARKTKEASDKALKEAENRSEEAGSPTRTTMETTVFSPRLLSFSVGLPGSPDLLAARKVAKHIGTIHHEMTFTIQEGLDAIREVIYHLESYDVTTVRASTPMYLLSRKIKATGVKMVLSGEGADEVFGGYLYFHSAPTPKDLHVETVKRVKLLHTSDCLRANKSTMAWGLEARVPFLDTKLLELAMTLPPEFKHPKLTAHKIEKEILRAAFDVEDSTDVFGHPNSSYLPEDILWRQKEQFSDGVGYSWIDLLKLHTESLVSDEQFSLRDELYPYNTPSTREAFFYRAVFEGYYCTDKTFDKASVLSTVVKWVPRKDWGCNEDPSGRAQNAHVAAYEEGKKRKANGEEPKSSKKQQK